MYTAKSVLQYLKRTISLKLIFKGGKAHFIELYKLYNIIRYVNSNYISNLKD